MECPVLDQYLHSNINTRTDAYGGSPEARCKFPVDLVRAVADAVGASNVGVRIEPAGLYNGTYGGERVETWSYLCEQLASTRTGSRKLSYVHFIEPRLDRVETSGDVFHNSWTLPEVSNATFRAIIQAAGIPCFTCGGWDPESAPSAVESAGWDGVAFARWFVSNPDLPERLRRGKELQAYDRSRFYGSWDGVRSRGYTDYPTWDQQEAQERVKEAKEASESKLVEIAVDELDSKRLLEECL